MRPTVPALVLCGLLAVTAQQASTAGNSLPESTAVYRATTVTGGTPLSMGYTVVAGNISAVTPKLRGEGLIQTLTNLNPKTVTAQFHGNPAVVCVMTSSTLLNSLTGLGEASYDCAGLTERADRPGTLHIRVG